MRRGATILLLLSFTLITLAYEEEPAEAVVIQRCVSSNENGARRPSVPPTSCSNSMGDDDCATMFGVSEEIQKQNEDENNSYKVNSTCYNAIGRAVGSQCRSMCALCCEHGELSIRL
ncbi:hypothetical protein Tcan_08180 [Toxocara canis]|uniref:Secreted protein n=1 Tax=Toxocara canis TaxID=6265 RepID=A0A0B2VQX5_TOXCA|nr:hypothetical protein Tcan_08180 [Toxocara canis]